MFNSTCSLLQLVGPKKSMWLNLLSVSLLVLDGIKLLASVNYWVT